jgi:formylglycine-generating enzyme required for sulfatase activity
MGSRILIATICLSIFDVLSAAGHPPFRDCGDCPAMVALPTGSFWMGSAPEDLDWPFLMPQRVLIEQPRHQVSIGCLCISWQDAQAYVDWLGAKTGHAYRLSSEAEWEYAARAGTITLWPWGDDKNLACLYANGSDRSGLAAGVSSARGGRFECDDGFAFTAPADFGRPNAFGLHGMIGNVGEWQADCLFPNHQGAPVDGQARVREGCTMRVMRGGSWFNPPMYNRPAFRYGTGQHEAYVLVRFRVVRPVSEE